MRAAAGTARDRLLPLAVAAVVGLDYFDNAAFAFYAAPIAGGLDAPLDELVWATSAYALAAVLGIVQYQWWIERIGHRAYVAGGCLLFGLAGLGAAACGSSLGLAAARAVQGYAIGPMLGAARILIRTDVAPARRGAAIRLFLTMILLGSALAPLLVGSLIATSGWRALFVTTAVGAFLIGGLAAAAVPATGRVGAGLRIDPELWPYAVFTAALASLQVVAQQVRHELFGGSPMLQLAAGLGVGGLGWFVRHQLRQPGPLLRWHGLRERAFRTGLLLYALYYGASALLSYLSARLLIGGLDYPVETAGRLVGACALPAIPVLLAYLAVSGHVPRRKPVIASGFVLAGAAAAWSLRLPPDASMGWLVPPLVMRGLLLVFIVLPVANATFGSLDADDFVQHYRVKNIVRQVTLSLSAALILVLEQHRVALHYDRLRDAVTPANPAVAAVAGVSSATDLPALARLSALVTRQATFLATLDGYLVVLLLALGGALFALSQRAIR